MNPPTWYYLAAGQPAGPIEQPVLVAMVRSGALPRGTPVWREGMPGWTAWELLLELGALVGPPVAWGYPKAPLGARFAASVVDSAILMIPLLLLGVGLTVAAIAEVTWLAVVLGALLAIAFVWAMVYSFIKDGRPGGQSLGKKWMGLMVVHLPSHTPCTRGKSALRQLVSSALGFAGGSIVEPILVMVNDDGRRLGDLAAATQVIAVEHYRRPPG